jgi:hypothetical protein
MEVLDLTMLKRSRELCYSGWGFFPTLLLDLRKTAVRLANGRDLRPSNGGYVALSYFWGNTVPEDGNTASETFQWHRENIKFVFRPKTLREVIIVIRSLGVSFLLIDIEIDRDKESTMMSHVYSLAINTCEDYLR